MQWVIFLKKWRSVVGNGCSIILCVDLSRDSELFWCWRGLMSDLTYMIQNNRTTQHTTPRKITVVLNNYGWSFFACPWIMYQVTLIWFSFIGTSQEKKELQSNLEVNCVQKRRQRDYISIAIFHYFFIFGVLDFRNWSYTTLSQILKKKRYCVKRALHSQGFKNVVRCCKDRYKNQAIKGKTWTWIHWCSNDEYYS